MCPQDNVLWDDLTGPEHLEFYGRLKNLTGKELKQQVRYWLEQVNLWRARKKLSRQYSGGMKVSQTGQFLNECESDSLCFSVVFVLPLL